MKLLTVLLLALALAASGCVSGKATIEASSTRVHALAGSTLVHAAKLESHVDEAGRAELEGIRRDQEAIQAEVTGKIKPALDDVVDKPGLWATLKRYAVWAKWIAILVALTIILGNFGVPGPAHLLFWLGKKGITLTRGAVDQARLAAQMVAKVESPDTPAEVKMAVHSYVAMLRTLAPSVSGRFSRERQ